MRNDNSDFMLLPSLPEDNKIPQYKQVIQVNLYHFYIITEIDQPEAYLDLINVLKTAEAHDTIFIYLNTPGGSLSTAVQIIGAIRQCAGTVVTCLEGEVCSAGTMIFLSGHRHIISPHSTFMIHNYSHWFGGKGNEVVSYIKYQEQYFRKLARDVYSGFLTDEEIDAVFDGKDFWMDSDEVLRRLGIEESEDPNDVTEGKIAELTEQLIDDE